MQTVGVVVYRKETRHVVIVDKGHQIILPGEVAALLRKHAVNYRKIAVGHTEHVSNRRVQREIQKRDAALVRELVRVVIERIGGAALLRVAEDRTAWVRR